MKNTSLHHLTNDALIAGLKSLAARGRAITVDLILHLIELEKRRLHRAAGYTSMFAYCRGELLLSEHEAYHRIQAARTARRFPVVLEMLTAGQLSLTTVKLLAPHLTAANHAEVLASAQGMSRRQVERLVAALAPQPDVPVTVRRLPSSPAPAMLPDAPTVSAPSRAEIAALSPDRYKMQLTISGATLEKLELAKELLSHAVPSGDAEAILERALTLLVDDLMKKKFAATRHPRTGTATVPGSRRVPAEVQRAVHLRDGGRCAFVSAGGHRCGSRAFLEFHHVRPYAHGGPATVDNIELRCRSHNLHEWEKESTQLRVQELEWQERELSPRRAQRARGGLVI